MYKISSLFYLLTPRETAGSDGGKSQHFWQLLKTKINKSNSLNQLAALSTKFSNVWHTESQALLIPTFHWKAAKMPENCKSGIGLYMASQVSAISWCWNNKTQKDCSAQLFRSNWLTGRINPWKPQNLPVFPSSKTLVHDWVSFTSSRFSIIASL